MKTIGYTKNHFQRNKIKGTAMELILSASKNNKQDNDSSIRNIIKKLSQRDDLEHLYVVSSPFKINDINLDRGNSFFYDEVKKEQYIISIKHKILDKSLKICSNKTCKKREQRKLNSKRGGNCEICNSKLIIETKTLPKEKILIIGNDLNKILNYLKEEGYIYFFKDYLNRRIDFFDYEDDTISIFEAKNKEVSGIGVSDLKCAFIYPYILQKYSYLIKKDVKYVNFIYNGEANLKKLNSFISAEEKLKRFKINLITIEDFCKNNKTEKGFISECIINWDEEKKDYDYYINYNLNCPKNLVINIKSCNLDVKDQKECSYSETRTDERENIYDEITSE